jgi:4-oxalmesaconate hydratase
MIEGHIFDEFPNLKIIVSHGGGSVPYQIGRWRANYGRHLGIPFDEALRKFYFDSVLYNQESVEFLIKMVGSDRVMFGTENPGTGHVQDKDGNWLDDIKPYIDAIPWLTEVDRKNVFEDNAKKAFTRFKM